MSKRRRRRRIVPVMATGKRKELLERREAIAREIAAHPRPITGCDVHFNRLLEERALITEEINRLDAAQSERSAAPD